MKKEKLSGKVPKPRLHGKKIEIASRSQERRRPIPPPNYTIEEPKVEARKPGTSEETDTGPPVGREVW